MPASREQIVAIIQSERFTKPEKFIVKWQFGMLGDFQSALIEAIKLADEGNLSRLAEGFPDEVGAFLSWSRGNLGDRLRAAGLNI